ncbi:MAG: response regulator transcription factor [Opitutae bacterium]|nr:response regulator transcription factor [Opitutae bacterium]
MTSSVTLLVVDDHALLRRGLKNFLESQIEGAQVFEAESAEQAYEQLKSSPADVVIMDIELPGDNGIEAARKIRASHPKTKVIILSGLPAGETFRRRLKESLRVGVDGFLSKIDVEDCAVLAVRAARKNLLFLSPLSATELARDLRTGTADSSTQSQLTLRESMILKRLAQGASYKEIADEQGISVRTVDSHRTRLTKKLSVSSREDLHSIALKMGLLG